MEKSGSVVNKLNEFFLLKHKRQVAQTVPPTFRSFASQQVALGKQELDAAESLWTQGFGSEALRLMKEGLAALTHVLSVYGGARSDAAQPEVRRQSVIPDQLATYDPVLAALGLDTASRALVLDALQEARKDDIPLFNQGLSSDYSERFRKLSQARSALLWALDPVVYPPQSFKRQSVLRIAAASLIAAVVLFFLLKPPPPVVVSASSFWRGASDIVPEKVLDGNPATEWHLDDHSPGWLDIKLNREPDIKTLKVLNGHNRHYNDRAVREFTVDFYVNGKRVKVVSDTFETFSSKPEWRTYPVNLREVDRIVFNVNSWHHAGGSLAELAWE